LGSFIFAPLDGCPTTANLLSLNASIVILMRDLYFEVFGLGHRTLIRPALCCYLRSSTLAFWINQGTQWFSGEPLETSRTRCSLWQSPLFTWFLRSPDSTLVLRHNQETVHNFVLQFLPPCRPHLTPLATRSLEPSLLIFSTLGGLIGHGLLCLCFTCTNISQAAACPTILGQESVHTMLSITHHTRKRPSTGPRTT
jgi:hypothetical protein